MSGAYYEKIARINLTTGEIKPEPLDLDIAHKFIGGRGLGTKILYDEGVATVDPLSPENKLVYITGPMTGSNSPSSGRYMVVTKSPLTGMIACANSGGIWGAKLKFAGWDALSVEGAAPEWSYLYIEDSNINDLSCVLLLNISRNRQVIVILGYLVIWNKAAEVFNIILLSERCHDLSDIILSQLVIVRNLDTFL